MMPEPAVPETLLVQLGYLRGAMAELKQQSESNGQELDSLSQKMDHVESEQVHYNRKVDEIHKEIVGNGGPGLRRAAADHETRITVLEEVKVPEGLLLEHRIESASELGDIKISKVKEGAIDWKFVAMLLLNLVVAGLVITNRM